MKNISVYKNYTQRVCDWLRSDNTTRPQPIRFAVLSDVTMMSRSLVFGHYKRGCERLESLSPPQSLREDVGTSDEWKTPGSRPQRARAETLNPPAQAVGGGLE